MRRTTNYHHPDRWGGEVVATLTLPYADRHRRRIRLQDDSGEAFLLDLPHAVRLEDGGGLELEGGGFIRVRAAEEEVTDILCRSAVHAARLAWHIGNRHAPVQVLEDDRLRILSDPVLDRMLTGLGAELRAGRAPFAPEGGAYGGGGETHEHGH